MKLTFALTAEFASLAPAMKALIWSSVSSAGKVLTMPITFDLVSLPASVPSA
jgi:hypothetical protein